MESASRENWPPHRVQAGSSLPSVHGPELHYYSQISGLGILRAGTPCHGPAHPLCTFPQPAVLTSGVTLGILAKDVYSINKVIDVMIHLSPFNHSANIYL